VLARGAPDTVERAMADTLTAYQHASALDVIGMRGEGKLREGLQRLLQLASVSHGHLSRSMSKHFGCRPVEFVNRTRLSHAAMLLATTADPIGRVAERSGFSRQSYFRPALSCHHGQTPRAYREQARRAAVPKEP
jgi:AraC-like DNA-binding protein